MFENDGSLNVTYNLYKVLELRPPCTDEEITRGYRKAALKYHPDKPNGSQERFQQIKAAHEILKNPVRREFYDRFGDKSLPLMVDQDELTNKWGPSAKYYDKIGLKILARPVRLIPLFIFIAMLGILFVLFLNLVDKKLYYSGLKNVHWYYIFLLLWPIMITAVLGMGVYFYFKVKFFKWKIWTTYETEPFKSLPESRRKFVSFIINFRDLCHVGESLIAACVILFYYLNVLPLNLSDDGKLVNGMTWFKLFEPFIAFLFFTCIINIVLEVVSLLQYQNFKDNWKANLMDFTNEIFFFFSSAVFAFYFCQWLDSSDRSLMTLSMLFALIYARIILNAFNFYYGYYQVTDQMRKKFLETAEPGERDEIEKKFKSQIRSTKWLAIISSLVFCFTIGLVHSHMAGKWPETWSMTLFPILICVFCSILVFGLCCPCLVTCMDMALPANSFDKFDFTGDINNAVIIEIPRGHRFGYGLAPLQGRLTYNRRL